MSSPQPGHASSSTQSTDSGISQIPPNIRGLLQRYVHPSDDDGRMRVALLSLWGSFNVILKQDPQRSKCLA
ncbi:hypothetical protein M378DRAFT_169913, partial [Amanita muscaria Koide BX008]